MLEQMNEEFQEKLWLQEAEQRHGYDPKTRDLI